MQATTQGALQDALSRAFQRLTVAIAARASHDPDALRRPDYTLLTVLERLGAARPSDLAVEAGHDLSTISRRIGGLVDAGWLAREHDPADGRACLVMMTAEGRRRLAAERAARAAIVTDVLIDWSDTDLTTLTSLLERLCDDLAEARSTPFVPTPERTSA